MVVGIQGGYRLRTQPRIANLYTPVVTKSRSLGCGRAVAHSVNSDHTDRRQKDLTTKA